MNQTHLLFGILASFFLPFGFLAMARLSMRHTPWLGTLASLLALPSWIPLSALIGLDALSYDMAQMGGGAQFVTLWNRFSGDGVMLPYLLIYAACHLISTILLGIALGRARIIPIWAACALIVSSPLTIIAFPLPHHHFFLVVVLLLLVVGCAPASLAMLKSQGEEGSALMI